MTRLPLTARIFVSVVILSGAGLVAASLPLVRFPRPGLFASLLALSVISSALKVDMPVGVGSSCISLSYIVDFTALLLLGPQPTMLIAMASGWCQCTYRMKERNPTYKTVFSMACLALTVAAAGFAYRWLGGTPGSLSATPLQPLLAAALTYFLVNSLAVAAAFALANRRPILRVWHDNFLWSISSYVIGGLVAGLTVELFQRAGHWQTSLAFVPLCLTYRTYKIYLGRIAAEQRRVAEWTQLHRESTEVLARAIQAKDGSNPAHVERVQYYAGTLARHLHLSELDRQAVEIAALLHDVGKLAVPEQILSKPGPLTADERRKMQIHAQIGAEIVGAVPFPFPVAPLVLSHHERWDGAGYPSGLRGAQIPIGARILAVVDCFDAVTSERPYRRAVSQDDALRILQAGAGNAFDPAIVKEFTRLVPTLDPSPLDESSRKRRLASDHIEHETATTVARATGGNAFAEIALANRESYTLYEIAHAMGKSLSLTETMTLISSKISGLVPFSSCALFVREQNTLRCRFATGINAHLMRDAEVEEGIGPCGWVARHERPIVNGVPNAKWNGSGATSGDTLESALVCPLIVGSRLIGTIGVFHVAAGCYTDDHRRVLEQICQQASAVIHNALVFEQAQDEALKDGLTGLANARALHSHATRELDRAQRTGLQFSLVVLDLDDFKSINDTYGHLAGDRALREVATALRETTRPYDMCIRYGGDEFVVLLASCGRTEAEERRRTFQEMVAAITLKTEHGEPIPLSISAGVGVFPEDGDTYERLLARADRRMYKDKAGRKRPPRLALAEMRPRLDRASRLRSVAP